MRFRCNRAEVYFLWSSSNSIHTSHSSRLLASKSSIRLTAHSHRGVEWDDSPLAVTRGWVHFGWRASVLFLFFCFTRALWLSRQGLSARFPGANIHPTCMESALIISPRNRFPISIASLDLPVPVAPKITTNDGITAFLTAACTPRTDAAMMPLFRRPADGGAHAQRAPQGERLALLPGNRPSSLWKHVTAGSDGGSFILWHRMHVVLLTFESFYLFIELISARCG